MSKCAACITYKRISASFANTSTQAVFIAILFLDTTVYYLFFLQVALTRKHDKCDIFSYSKSRLLVYSPFYSFFLIPAAMSKIQWWQSSPVWLAPSQQMQ